MSQGLLATAALVRWAQGYLDVPAMIVNTRTHRVAYTGPNGEPGFGTDPGGGAVSTTMPDGRVAWYFVGATPEVGNVQGLANYNASLNLGRVETFLSLGSIKDPIQARDITRGVLGDHQVPMVSTVVGLEPAGSADEPYSGFGIGDWIAAPDPSWLQTTIAAGSAGAVLPQATINVASTTGFPSAGKAIVGSDVVSWTGKTSTTFTGCTGGSGTLILGEKVYLAQVVQVESLTVAEDDEGNAIYTPELGTLSQDLAVKTAAWLKMMTAGTLGGSVQAASPAPAYPPTPAVAPDDVTIFHQPGPSAITSVLSGFKAPSRSGTLYKVTAELTVASSSGSVVVTVYLNTTATVLGTITIPAGALYPTTPLYLTQAVQGILTASPSKFGYEATSPGTGAVDLMVAFSVQ